MSLYVRQLRAERPTGAGCQKTSGRQITAAVNHCGSRQIVDQSFQIPSAPGTVMNTRKTGVKLNRSSQTRVPSSITTRSRRPEAMKSRLLQYHVRRSLPSEIEAGGRIPDRLARHAIAEAEALASSTAFPLLFLPGLMEEKLRTAGNWADRQREILDRQKSFTVTE